MNLIYGIVWLLVAAGIGVWGDTRRCGFWGGFLGSFFLSPLVGVIIVATSKSKEDMRREFEEDQRRKKEMTQLQNLATAQGKDVPTQLAELQKMLNDGVLTQAEYDAAKAKVLS